MSSAMQSGTSHSPLKIALFVEGVTDNLFVQEVVRIVLADHRAALFHVISPHQLSNNLEDEPDEKNGWRGVFRRIVENRKKGKGIFNQSFKLRDMDVIIIHLDLDVTWHLLPDFTGNLVFDLDDRCNLRRGKKSPMKTCPINCSHVDNLRIENTVDRLRQEVLGNWIGEYPPAPRIVFWNPAVNLESWIVAMKAPYNTFVEADQVECYDRPGKILKRLQLRDRFKGSQADYKDKVIPRLEKDGWRIGVTCRQYRRFIHELKNCFRTLGVF